MITYFLLVLGFGFLIGGATILVDGASSLSSRLKVSDLVIGLTIVAFGTSTPELVVNIYAAVNGNAEIAIGNILGSNIANILLILGVSAIITPLMVREETVLKEIPLSLLAVIVLGILANDMLIDHLALSALTRIDGFVLLSFFIIFMYYIFSLVHTQRRMSTTFQFKLHGLVRSVLFIVLGLAGLYIGAQWVVTGSIKLARALGISELFIGLTIVAVGTSLPELATSAMAALKRNTDIAVGNIVGSNIFNIFFILGVSAIIRPLPFNNAGNENIGITIAATALLFVAMFTGRKKKLLERWEGILFVVFYMFYVAYLVYRS